eukprot:scaffold292126_cov28-Tisochrysis_lutea.AAC.1
MRVAAARAIASAYTYATAAATLLEKLAKRIVVTDAVERPPLAGTSIGASCRLPALSTPPRVGRRLAVRHVSRSTCPRVGALASLCDRLASCEGFAARRPTEGTDAGAKEPGGACITSLTLGPLSLLSGPIGASARSRVKG